MSQLGASCMVSNLLLFLLLHSHTIGKAIIAAAIRGSKAPDSEKLAAACEKERNWRFGYNKHFNTLVRAYVPRTNPFPHIL